MADELTKIADVLPPGQPVDPSTLADPNDPNDPITRYQSMQRRKPIARDMARGAALGAVTAPALSTLKDVIAKGRSEAFKPQLGRRLGAAATVGAISGSLIPLLQSHMALKAEGENVKQQLGMTPDTGVRSALRRTVGVG
jgi:hypothetical protein